MNLFQSILDKASNVTGIGMSDPTKSSVYKFLSPYEQTAQNVTGAMQDTAKMYEQKAQGISQWGQNVANKPGYAKLGKMVKAKYPEYSDISDEELGQKMLAKYPEYNDIVSGETSALGYGAKALSGIGSMAVSAPGMVAGGAEQLGTGIGTIASSQSGQDVAQGVLQAGKGAVQAGFGVATGAMPIASTLFGAASGFEPVQKGFQYLGQKAGDISAGTAGLLGGNQAVQEQARGFGEVALPALALGGVSKSGKVIRPVAKATGKAIVRGAEVVAPKVVQGVKTGVQTTGEGVGKVTKSIVSQQSGLGTPAIESILKTPELQGKIRSGELSGAKTLEEARSSIDALREGYRETGKMYDTVRKSNIPVAKNEAKQVLISQLESEGLATGGKLNLVDLPVKDRGAITQALKYIDEYGDTMTPQNALSIRQKLDDLINYKSDVGSNGQRIVQGLRAKYDEFLGNKLPGLKEIDTKYAPERQFWESVRKDIYKADGTLKDNALSVISNITNKGNEARLARMEQILPGIGEKVKALKAFEDIQNASGIKVGTYGRAATTGAIALASVPLAIASWVATHPVVVARVLEGIGLASQKIKSILSKGSKITPEEANIVAKAVAETPKSKVESIINNLAYDPKTNKLSSKTLVKNGNNRTNTVLVSDKGAPRKVEQKTIVKPNTIKNESKVSNINASDTIPEGYFKNAFGEIQKNPSNKKGGFIKIPEIGKKVEPLIEEAKRTDKVDSLIKYFNERKSYQWDLLREYKDGIKASFQSDSAKEVLSKLGLKGDVAHITGIGIQNEFKGMGLGKNMFLDFYKRHNEIKPLDYITTGGQTGEGAKFFKSLVNEGFLEEIQIPNGKKGVFDSANLYKATSKLKDSNPIDLRKVQALSEAGTQKAKKEIYELFGVKVNNQSKSIVKNPLVEEARKYKSAEEFVKAQGEPVYHGTYAYKTSDMQKVKSIVEKIYKNNGGKYEQPDLNKVGIDAEYILKNKDKIKIKDESLIQELQDELSSKIKKPTVDFSGKSGKDVTDNSLGIYTTPDIDFAKRFTYDIDVNPYSGKKTIIQPRQGYVIDMYYKGNTLDLTKGASKHIDLLSEITGKDKEFISSKLKTKEGTKVIQKLLSNKRDILKQKGFNAVKNYAWDDTVKKYKEELAILDDNSIKTKEELTSIWKKSQ